MAVNRWGLRTLRALSSQGHQLGPEILTGPVVAKTGKHGAYNPIMRGFDSHLQVLVA